MEKNNKMFIPEQHFDVLLQQALLENEKMFNEKTFQQMATHVFTARVEQGSPAAGKRMITRLEKDFRLKKSFFSLNIFIVSFLIVAGTTAAVYFSQHGTPGHSQQNIIAPAGEQNETNLQDSFISKPESTDNPLPKPNPLAVAIMSAPDDEKNDTPAVHETNSPKISFLPGTARMYIPKDSVPNDDDIPVLTDEQIRQTLKDKQKLLHEIAKGKLFVILPMGSASVNGVQRSIQAFGIQNSEVTNQQYRTFLYDLLIQGRKADYRLARPVKGGWKAAGLPKFENVYFTSEKYNDFPVVNITPAAAQMYCKWLTASMEDAIAKNEVKWKNSFSPYFRLPCNAEWIYAARGCDTGAIKYPWSRTIDSVYNHHGCFLCDFNFDLSKDKLARWQGPVGKKGCTFITGDTIPQPVVTTAGRAIDTLVSAPVYSYNPNTKGLYCMMGNVSEMAWTFDFSNPQANGPPWRAMGGSWYSDVDNVQVEAQEQYAGFTNPTAYIGFRPVLSVIMKK